ncbi:hypothetical protein [Flectobacillus sp. BAB-3569]|uniref:hypothetical protein n=1 Tax=Flectobacillus sp. BAB-3569 TaxID=1509483 RepID=UPI0011405B79|nr:hypothetical protein [Flectobacillus sp. BAB-3569]
MKFDVLSNTLLRQIALILSILLLGGLLFTHLGSFIPALLGAYTLYILLGGWVKKWRKNGNSQESSPLLL